MFLRLSAILLCVFFAATSWAREAGFTLTEPPQKPPAFTFQDEKSRDLTLADFKGKVVILNFWASWCGPCVEEMPSLNALAKKLDTRKFVVLAVAQDHDGLATARAFYRRHSIDRLAVYADRSGEAPFAFRVTGLPTTILIDPAGMEVARLTGDADWTSPLLISTIQKFAKK